MHIENSHIKQALNTLGFRDDCLRHIEIDAQTAGLPLLQYLIEKNLTSSLKLAEAFSRYFKLDRVDLFKNPPNPSVFEYLEYDVLTYYAFLPYAQFKDTLIIAISDPQSIRLFDKLNVKSHLKITWVIAPCDQHRIFMNTLLSEYVYRNVQHLTYSQEKVIIIFTNQCLTDAIYRDASDIHFEPQQHHYRVRMRIDGLLTEIITLPLSLMDAVNSRLKILADLDIAIKRLSQDGRFSFQTQSGIIRDCRISTCPTLFGEKIVIRLINVNPTYHDFDSLGLNLTAQNILCKIISQPQGLILITGPTGSGKTVTLFTILNSLNTIEKNIVTIEDPIEVHMPGISQVSINLKGGFNFATAIRTFLRQDPDVILVGEIRDSETALMAIRAANTGHLVLATLHTNSAIESVTRLIHLGVEPYQVSSTLICTVAQRLVRKLCNGCKRPVTTIPPIFKKYFKDSSSITLYENHSCHSCMNGYKDRIGIFEIITYDPSTKGIKVPVRFQSLIQDGIQKVKTGITNFSELLRILPASQKNE